MNLFNARSFGKRTIESAATVIDNAASCIAATTLCILAGAVAHAIPGQPGTLDATWASASPNGAGTVITPIGGGIDTPQAIALQPDGKVIVAGYCYDGTHYGFCALRYRANGTLDTSWGSAGTGIVATPIGVNDSYASAVAAQPDGKVLLAGHCSDGTKYDFCALRYLVNGTLDTSWGSAGTGIVTTSIGSGGNDFANAMTLQPDGKVLLVGRCSNGGNDNFCALRYRSDGTLDPSWNSTGKVVTSLGGNDDQADAMAVQPDGKVLLAGSCDNGIRKNFCALRYLADGTLDTSWNGNGRVVTSIDSNDDRAASIVVQPDGKVLLAGTCDNGANEDFCSLRYHADGTLDTDWGIGGTGKVVTGISIGDDYSKSAVLQPDGKLLLAGFCDGFLGRDFCTVRYNNNGTLDTSWGNVAKVTTSVVSASDQAAAIVLQPDGKVLLAGGCNNGLSDDFCAVRYDGGPFGYKACTLDLDGDNVVRATTDMLIGARVALGMTGAAVVNGITFSANARRDTWPLIRDYLVAQCGMTLQSP
jgi:uncharacterized delta-60 repeat protein